MKTRTLLVPAVFLTMLAIAPMAYAQGGPTGQMMQGSRRAEMMKKLADACKDKKANDPCSFARSDGSTANGTCEMRGSELLCMTARMTHRGGMSGMGHMGGGMMGTPSGGTGPSNP